MANRYRRALKQLSDKNKNIDEKLRLLEALPTNNTVGVYSKDTVEIEPPEKYWSGGELNQPQNSDFSQDYLANDPTGQDTSGLIGEDGTVFSKLPPESEGFILGPIVDEFVSTKYGSYTSIGYLQKDTRQFVLLAKIDGQWEHNMNGSHPVWDGTENGLTIYNQKFTLEMAQWVKERISLGDYVKDVPYFYSGGLSENLKLPNAPDNMRSGNGIGPVEYEEGTFFTPKQEEMIQVNLTQFFRDTNDRSTFDFQVGRLAAGMSIKQVGELMKKANERWGK